MIDPPPVSPAAGDTPVTVGPVAPVTVKWSEEEVSELPLGVTTVISYVAALSAGATAVMEVEEVTVKLVAGTDPKKTFPAPVSVVPVIVTEVPPALVPVLGLTPVIVGTLARV
jgi:hypothetical protein